MDQNGPTDSPELSVTFFPPLHEQRRAWVLDVLRQEHVKSVADIGSGEGSLLQCLTLPALFLPTTSSGQPIQTSELTDIEELHPSSLTGLDISPPDLEVCVKALAPPDPNKQDPYTTFPRWEPLEVDIWKGSLVDLNPSFFDKDCMVLTEVIEHLQPDVLEAFPKIFLGCYRPSLLLITTPSYTFNARFSRPGMMPTSGWPDPTGRTTRVFRHHDHKFEWTVEEFQSWCQFIANEYGYEVQLGGVGRAQEVDEWGRDDVLGFASQTALFRRRIVVRTPETWIGPVAHELLARYKFPCHPRAGRVEPLSKIQEKVKEALCRHPTSIEEGETIRALWVAEAQITESCGGYITSLFEAVEKCCDFTLICPNGNDKSRLQWIVKLNDVLAREILSKQPAEEVPDDDMEDEWLAQEMQAFKLEDNGDVDWEYEEQSYPLLDENMAETLVSVDSQESSKPDNGTGQQGWGWSEQTDGAAGWVTFGNESSTNAWGLAQNPKARPELGWGSSQAWGVDTDAAS